MSKSLDNFISLLLRSGLVTSSEIERLREGHVVEDEAVAQQLADSGHLTDFQRSEVLQGKADSLILGEYLILDRLGQGGMGQVYKARHSLMKRDVAVKFTLPSRDEKSAASAVERFKREVEAASKLTHPNIVNALDAGHRGDLCYLVMEYVRGKNLTSVVRSQGPMSFPQALDCILQVAQGLEYAHRQGVVHRDIKPSNLLLTDDGAVKILDMGLARVDVVEEDDPPQAAEQTEEGHLTHQGQLLGTVDFMAPEQAVNPREADGRADIYSLGCTLFFLLTGKAPFRGEGRSVMSRLIAHRESPIPSICDARPDVPESFEPVFRRMMAKQVRRRYQNLQELIIDLRSAQLRFQESTDTLQETISLSGESTGGLMVGLWAVLAAALLGVGVFLGIGWLYPDALGPAPPVNGGSGDPIASLKSAIPSNPQRRYDALQLIDLARDVIAPGKDLWKLADGRLLIPAGQPKTSKLQLRVDHSPRYRIQLDVVRKSGVGPLVVGVVVPPKQCYLIIDVDRNFNRITAMGTDAQGKLVQTVENELTLETDEPRKLTIEVDAPQLTLSAAGQVVLVWSGDFSQLDMGGGWGIRDPKAFMIGSNDGTSFEIRQWLIEPLEEPSAESDQQLEPEA